MAQGPDVRKLNSATYPLDNQFFITGIICFQSYGTAESAKW